MESIALCRSSFPPLKPQKPTSRTPSTPLSFDIRQVHLHTGKASSLHLTPPNSLSFKTSLKPSSSLPILLGFLSSAFPSLASDISAPAEQSYDKINLESILVSIDDFFNRSPFFVAGVTVTWLIIIPLVQVYLRKYKFISAIDAFRKLRDESSAQLLDIRDRKNLAFLGSPNLKILNKDVVQVHFSEGNEDRFLSKVLEEFRDPKETVVCILDSFDGNSLKVAELLVKNGFKEAYAIEGGLRGKKGWQDIQEELLPPSVHVYRKKKVERSQLQEVNGGVHQLTEKRISTSGSQTDSENNIAQID